MACTNCGKSPSIYQINSLFGESFEPPKPIAFLCSPSCLVEYGWTLKQDQTKLSKSKET